MYIDEDSPESCMDLIKQFNLCKRFIISNSIPLEVYDQHEHNRVYGLSNQGSNCCEESDEDFDYKKFKNQYTFEVNAHNQIKRMRIKKKMVIDASKILRMIDELHEHQQFSYILNCPYIS